MTDERHPLTEAQRHDADLGFDLPQPTQMSTGRIAATAAVAFLALGAVFAFSYLPRRKAREALEERSRTAQSDLPRVEVITPKIGSSDRALRLPGSVQALRETVVYSRANGYVRRWLVDIGDAVQENQVLAEIDTPELDAELDQARAQLLQATAAVVQAKANRDYSKSTYERYKPLTQSGVTSQQDLDQQQARAAVDEANVQVAEANVVAHEADIHRLVQLKTFAHVVAPFAGKIASRSIEVGTLVTAGTASPLFRIAAVDPARVFVQVPQDVAPSVRPDLPARVTVREYPDRTFEGRVTRSSNELDPGTRTMNTEVRVPNADGALIPGMYSQVALTLPYPHRVFQIPATAVINDAKGIRVAVVGPDDAVHIVPIVVERDNGATFDVAAGLTGGERVIKLPSVDLDEGRSVAIATNDAPPAASSH
ncbi:MAG TPA: efflux RND transporter periplasmic adaptor subunit [Polyangiaceae bacterium]|nr:efflux RND transporter periplasmic adaptor subunit [Polyangiaceae bacterium]